MRITVDTKRPVDAAVDFLVLLIAQIEGKDAKKAHLAPRVAAVDRALGGRVATVIAHGDFRGKSGQTTLLYPDDGAGVHAFEHLVNNGAQPGSGVREHVVDLLLSMHRDAVPGEHPLRPE